MEESGYVIDPNDDENRTMSVDSMAVVDENHSGDLTSKDQQDLYDQSRQSELDEKRQIVKELVSNPKRQKDIWYFIPAGYMTHFFETEAESIDELGEIIGPIDCKSITDDRGNLFPEEKEPVKSMHIPASVFALLVEWFGIKGSPVARYMLKNEETGEKEIERFPPLFILHKLVNKPAQYHSNHKYSIVRLSQNKTFGELVDLARDTLFDGSNQSQRSRLWFIDSSNIQKFSVLISLSSFLHEINIKTLIHANILDKSLMSQGISQKRYHLMVEVADRTTGNFPIDNLIANQDLSQYDLNALMKSGGNMGLQNLGNTCYMNSALQCLLHIPEIDEYFLFNVFKKELNYDNPLGNRGEIANSFGNLLKNLFDNSSKSSSISPREFKSTIGRYSSMFLGYLQQDSQEFLSWLLDALHEDLNRIHNKPYCEKPELADDEVDIPEAIKRLAETCWKHYKQRNESVIVDLFTGMYQSTLVCPDCSKTSITFDPFNDLTLPLPMSRKWYHTFKIVSLDHDSEFSKPIMRLEVELNKTSNYDDLLDYLSGFLRVPKSYLFLYEIFRNCFYTDLQADYNKNKFLPISDIIRESDEIVVYVIPHDKETDLIIPVLNSIDERDKSYKINELFGLPLFIVLKSENEVKSFGTIRRKLVSAVEALTEVSLKENIDELTSVTKDIYDSDDFPGLTGNQELVEDSAITALNDGEIERDGGYESDISLANPYVDANYGFEIKTSTFSGTRVSHNNRFHFGNNNYESPSQVSDTFVRVPLSKPSYSDFQSISDKLSDKKRNYYHYSKFISELEARKEIEDEKEVENRPGEDGGEDYVMLTESESDAPITSAPQESSSDEETESEPQLGSLYDSTILSAPSEYDDSNKQSEINSPVSTPEQSHAENHPELVNKKTVILCDWDAEVYSKLFDEEDLKTWVDPPFIPNPDLERSKKQLEIQKNTVVSLYDCLKLFSTREVLGEHDLWYCPRCKDHKQASKTIQVWSTGDILTIHLKRFHSARAFSDKIDIVVDFPIEGLDISDYISNPDQSKEVYDLFAVDNHYGGLGGGHYTASVKNFRDNNWYYFNDSRVTLIEDPKECVNSAAYLLFYRKRSNSDFLGGEYLKDLIVQGREDYQRSLETRIEGIKKVKFEVDKYSMFEKKIESESLDMEEEKIDADKKEDPSSKKARSAPSGSSHEMSSEDDHNIRKQRLISKSDDSNKLIQIKSNGKKEHTPQSIDRQHGNKSPDADSD